MNLLERFKGGLQRTRNEHLARLMNLFGLRRVDEDALRRLEEALLQADLGPAAVAQVMARLRHLVKSQSLTSGEDAARVLKEHLIQILRSAESVSARRFSVRPWVVMLVGVNGSGKTTTAGKIAHYFASEGRRTVIAASDTFRAAAVEQLEQWAGRAGARIITQRPGTDPAAVAYDAINSALARGDDLVLVDTAGRLQAKRNLMEELAKIARVTERLVSGAPHESLLVIDATTGQNGLSQARAFREWGKATGIVLTKLDGTARGGIALSIASELALPLEFVGMGEAPDDLHKFDAEAFVDALLAP